MLEIELQNDWFRRSIQEKERTGYMGCVESCWMQNRQVLIVYRGLNQFRAIQRCVSFAFHAFMEPFFLFLHFQFHVFYNVVLRFYFVRWCYSISIFSIRNNTKNTLRLSFFTLISPPFARFNEFNVVFDIFDQLFFFTSINCILLKRGKCF